MSQHIINWLAEPADDGVDVNIEIDQPYAKSGGTLSGKVYIKVDLPVYSCDKLNVRICGREMTSITHLEEEDNELTQQIEEVEHVTYASSTILDNQYVVAHFPEGCSEGRHSFPFELHLPAGIPGTMSYEHDGDSCSIVYVVQALLEPKDENEHSIAAYLDLEMENCHLNSQSSAIFFEPSEEKITVMCCWNNGQASVGAMLNTNLVSADEAVEVSYELENRTTTPLNELTISLVEHFSYSAENNVSSSEFIVSSKTIDIRYLEGAQPEQFAVGAFKKFYNDDLEYDDRMMTMVEKLRKSQNKITMIIPDGVRCDYHGKLIELFHTIEIEVFPSVDTANHPFLSSRLTVHNADNPLYADEEQREKDMQHADESVHVDRQNYLSRFKQSSSKALVNQAGSSFMFGKTGSSRSLAHGNSSFMSAVGGQEVPQRGLQQNVSSRGLNGANSRGKRGHKQVSNFNKPKPALSPGGPEAVNGEVDAKTKMMSLFKGSEHLVASAKQKALLDHLEKQQQHTRNALASMDRASFMQGRQSYDQQIYSSQGSSMSLLDNGNGNGSSRPGLPTSTSQRIQFGENGAQQPNSALQQKNGFYQAHLSMRQQRFSSESMSDAGFESFMGFAPTMDTLQENSSSPPASTLYNTPGPDVQSPSPLTTPSSNRRGFSYLGNAENFNIDREAILRTPVNPDSLHPVGGPVDESANNSSQDITEAVGSQRMANRVGRCLLGRQSIPGLKESEMISFPLSIAMGVGSGKVISGRNRSDLHELGPPPRHIYDPHPDDKHHTENYKVQMRVRKGKDTSHAHREYTPALVHKALEQTFDSTKVISDWIRLNDHDIIHRVTPDDINGIFINIVMAIKQIEAAHILGLACKGIITCDHIAAAARECVDPATAVEVILALADACNDPQNYYVLHYELSPFMFLLVKEKFESILTDMMSNMNTFEFEYEEEY